MFIFILLTMHNLIEIYFIFCLKTSIGNKLINIYKNLFNNDFRIIFHSSVKYFTYETKDFIMINHSLKKNIFLYYLCLIFK